MTALAGFWDYGSGEDSRSSCASMLGAQGVYAPAPPVAWACGNVALGRRLFVTVPEDRYDAGPVVGGGGRWTLVADVRLDNRAELCATIGIADGRASLLCDSAVVMAAVERWETAAFSRLVGDFAIVLWDRDQGKLHLARDFLGRRPLHFHRAGGFFAFASMAKGLHALPSIPRAPDCRSVAAFVALLPESGSRTFFKGVEKVGAGHLVTVTRESVRVTEWWNPPSRELRLKDAGEYAEALREHVDRAVSDRLRGGAGRVASQLSAGLDSSTVTATAARLVGEAVGLVAAYTAIPRRGFSSPVSDRILCDEGPHASSLAAMFPSIEHNFVENGGSPLAGLDRNFELFERPALNLCNNVWNEKIKDLARERGFGILLNGGCGNMSISYDGMELLGRLARRGAFLDLARQSWPLVRNGTRIGTVGAQALGPLLSPFLKRGIDRLRGRAGRLTDYTAINPDAVGAMQIDSATEEHIYASRLKTDSVELRLRVLRRQDTGNAGKAILAGWGLDMRDPTADQRLIEFCLAVPLEQYLQAGRSRALAKLAFADRLPSVILNERRKGYQAADWYEGTTEDRAGIAMELERIARSPEACAVLDVGMMKRLVQGWPTAGWTTPATVAKYRGALLRGVSAGHFLRRASSGGDV